MDHPNGVRTALSIASEQGNFALVCGLLQYDSTCDLLDLRNSNVNSVDIEGRSPISYAAGNGHTEISNLLLQHGAVAHWPDLYGRTPLSWAAGGGHVSTVHLLLSPAYNVNANSPDVLGRTPFFWACANGHSQVVTMMLARHSIFPAYLSDYNGISPLAIAAANGHESVIKILLTYEKGIQDWVVTSWTEEMAKDAWKANNPGAWNFRATIAWDHIVSRLPQNKAMVRGHWRIAKLLRLHWESLDMGKYPIADNVKEKFMETTNNPDLNTHGYGPSDGSSYYPYEQAAGEVGVPAHDGSGTTNDPGLFTHGYGPSANGAPYPYEAAAGEVEMHTYDESGTTNNPSLYTRGYGPSDNHSYCYPNEQAASAVGIPTYDESGNTNNQPDLHTHEYGSSDYDSYYYPYQQTTAVEAAMPAYDDDESFGPTYAKPSTSKGLAGEATNKLNRNNKAPTQQAATATKKIRKRYRKPKAKKMNVPKGEEQGIFVAVMRKGIRSKSI